MSVRFIIGRAGTGKTHYCLACLQRRLRSHAAEGARLILLTPEQAALQMERALLDAPRDDAAAGPVLASHRAEVLSFRRLAFRVLEAAGVTTGVALTETARAMVLRHLARKHAAELRYYGRAARGHTSPGRLNGFLERLGGTINELIEEAVDPGELSALVDSDEAEREAVPAEAPAQRAKLHDVALLYRAYLDYLGEERLDPSQYLQAARRVLPRCHWLHGAELWVDGFASFSGQERHTLIELARLCATVEITALMDPALLDGGATGSPEEALTARRLFSRVHRTYLDLVRGFAEAGLEIEPPLVLSEEPPRFKKAPVLASVERSLFRPANPARHPGDRPSARDDTPTDGSRSSPKTLGKNRGVVEGGAGALRTQDPHAAPATQLRLVEVADRRCEVDYAVSQIIEWVQSKERGYRYRDLAIIVRDLDVYHDLLSGALEARGIPFFIDRRRPVGHHPFVELLRLAPLLIAESMSPETVRLLLKTDLLGLSREAADELENYLVAHGICGLSTWRAGPWRFRSDSLLDETSALDPEQPLPQDRGPEELDEAERERLRRINDAREQVLAKLNPWLTFAASQSAATGEAWAQALLEWLEHLDVAATLHRWFETARADGDLDQAEEHEQVYHDGRALLDDMAFALKDTVLTVRELSEVLDAGLSGLTLGLVPPTIDQVLVGSIERSRHPDIKAAVIVGFNEGVFPHRPSEDAILNDDDRTSLMDAGVRIGPPTRERIPDEAMLFYIAMTRAAESVVITWAAADEEGRLLRPSPFLPVVQAAYPESSIIRIGEPRRQRATWDVLCASDLRERIVREMRDRPPRVLDESPLRARWNELYEWMRQSHPDDPTWRYALSSLAERCETASLSPHIIERLYRGMLRTSVSQLETYAACPFQHFARYILNLRERPTAELAPIDMGRIHHAVLEAFIREAMRRQESFDAWDDETTLETLQAACERVASRLPEDRRTIDARHAYVLRRSASLLARVVSAQRKTGRVGRARPHGVEMAFGMDTPDSLPSLELTTPNGRRVLLRGFIDRVDLAEVSDELLGVVVDYKRRGGIRLDLSQVYNGISLQLIAYLLVLAEHGATLAGRPIRPIGALYVGLQSAYRLIDGPEDAESIARASQETYKPRGLIRFEDAEVLDASLSDAGRSSYYTLARKKDGGLSDVNRSDGATARHFDALLAFTRRRLGELADRLLEGNIAVRPYRLGKFSPCSWCSMRSVCRFEWGLSTPRFLDPLRRSEVLDRVLEYYEREGA